MRNFAPVAQLDRVPGYELGGRRFESFRAYHIKIKNTRLYRVFFYVYVDRRVRSSDIRLVGSTNRPRWSIWTCGARASPERHGWHESILAGACGNTRLYRVFFYVYVDRRVRSSDIRLVGSTNRPRWSIWTCGARASPERHGWRESILAGAC